MIEYFLPAALPPSARPQPVGFAQACRFWLWLGVVSFGGPAGQIAILHAELVE
jgi:chromate transporter